MTPTLIPGFAGYGDPVAGGQMLYHLETQDWLQVTPARKELFMAATRPAYLQALARCRDLFKNTNIDFENMSAMCSRDLYTIAKWHEQDEEPSPPMRRKPRTTGQIDPIEPLPYGFHLYFNDTQERQRAIDAVKDICCYWPIDCRWEPGNVGNFAIFLTADASTLITANDALDAAEIEYLRATHPIRTYLPPVIRDGKLHTGTAIPPKLVNGHPVFTDNDKDRPEVICDQNGQTVLNMCKVCGRAEIELDEPCKPEEAK